MLAKVVPAAAALAIASVDGRALTQPAPVQTQQTHQSHPGASPKADSDAPAS